jgi:CRISPR-associated protein Csh1
MLEAMRELALDFLHDKLGGQADESPEVFYQRIRESAPEQLFPYLVEDNVDEERSGRDKPRYYTLGPADDDPKVAVLETFELKASDAVKLPFNQPSGSQSAALGPLIKRTASSKTKPAGPSRKIQATTLKAFEEFGKAGRPWSAYFAGAHECWTRKKLRYGSTIIDAPDGALAAAIEAIDEKRTVLLAYRAADLRLPGKVPEYITYLRTVLATTKYTTGSCPIRPEKVCPLCGRAPIDVYPNALRGAGINLANLDRDGAFSGLDPDAAWKSFALCIGCADLLYIYCKHVAGTFRTRVAGENALALPTLRVADAVRKQFVARLRNWGADAPKKVTSRERQLLKALGEDSSVNSITLLWAEFGQRIDDIRGVVTDVLPSRLNELSLRNEQFNRLKMPIFPEIHLEEFEFDLSLSMLRPLFQCPGGKKAQSRNDSRRLFDLRRDIADAIYLARLLPWERFWAEIHQTARWHWDAACESDNCPYGLLYEGWSKKKNEGFLTVAGWVRHLARFLHYCRMIGRNSMSETAAAYQPGCEILKPYFGPESAIDSPAKAFAFVLGLLYGKLLQVQAARGVNVRANALTWLRRLTLSGKDLPELYTKVREKMLAYGKIESNPAVRELNVELAELVAKSRRFLQLGETDTCFFLLLGQSLAAKVLPSKTEGDSGDTDE